MQQFKESVLEETSVCKQETDEEEEEEEETLSLCDLPLYSATDQNYAEWEQDLSIESQGSNYTTTSVAADHHDYFEFSSQLHPTATATTENIIFCGKVIAYKQPDISEKRVVEITNQTNTKNMSIWRLFGWEKDQKDLNSKKMRSRRIKRHNFPMHKVSILASSSSGKSKWHLLLFGISRFSSNGVEWANMKSRQSRSSSMFRHPNDDHDVSGGRNRGSGLWCLIGALICGGNHHHATTMGAVQRL